MKNKLYTLIIILLTITSSLNIISAHEEGNITVMSSYDEEKLKSEEDRTGDIAPVKTVTSTSVSMTATMDTASTMVMMKPLKGLSLQWRTLTRQSTTITESPSEMS